MPVTFISLATEKVTGTLESASHHAAGVSIGKPKQDPPGKLPKLPGGSFIPSFRWALSKPKTFRFCIYHSIFSPKSIKSLLFAATNVIINRIANEINSKRKPHDDRHQPLPKTLYSHPAGGLHAPENNHTTGSAITMLGLASICSIAFSWAWSPIKPIRSPARN